jgi:AcrR family transcriptional regulator
VNTVHKTSAKQRILSAAQQLHEQGGIEAVSMRNVAEAVGVVAGAIYRHYRDKDALMDAMVEAGHGVLKRYLEEGARSRGDRVRSIMDRFVHFALDQPGLYDLMFMRPRTGTRRFPEDFAAGRSPTFAILHTAVVEEVRKGRYRRDDSLEITLWIWATAHGLVSMYNLGRFTGGATDFVALYHRTLRRALRGVKTPAGRNA